MTRWAALSPRTQPCTWSTQPRERGVGGPLRARAQWHLAAAAAAGTLPPVCIGWNNSRVGQNHTYIRIYGVYTVVLAGKSPFIRSYTVCIYGSGQP